MRNSLICCCFTPKSSRLLSAGRTRLDSHDGRENSRFKRFCDGLKVMMSEFQPGCVSMCRGFEGRKDERRDWERKEELGERKGKEGTKKEGTEGRGDKEVKITRRLWRIRPGRKGKKVGDGGGGRGGGVVGGEFSKFPWCCCRGCRAVLPWQPGLSTAPQWYLLMLPGVCVWGERREERRREERSRWNKN